MKKLLLSIIILMGGGVFYNAFGQQQIPMHIIDHSASSDGPTYAPPRPWYITQNGYVLTLPAFEDDYTMVLCDENNNVVYSMFIPAGTTVVYLPTTLSGEFEIRLVTSSFYFYGYITL